MNSNQTNTGNSTLSPQGSRTPQHSENGNRKRASNGTVLMNGNSNGHHSSSNSSSRNNGFRNGSVSSSNNDLNMLGFENENISAFGISGTVQN